MDKAFKKNGIASVKMGRPVKGVGSSFDKALISRIGHYRGLHPKWGSKTILVELSEKDKYNESDLPSGKTIERYIKSLSLTEVYEKHRLLATYKPPKVEACHDLWEMDDKGCENYPGIGEVSMINIKDVKSGAHIQGFGRAFPHKRYHPNMSDYQCALRLAFCEFGLPKCIQADHGSNFHESRGHSPFPTPLHLWLVGLGIDLRWARIYRPTDQAHVERTHQTLHDQIQQNFDFTSWEQFKKTVDQRRHRLNYHIPCDTLGKAPLVAFPEAKHSGRYFNPLLEKEYFDTQRIKEYLHNREWFRKVSDIKTISLGGHIYHLPKAKYRIQVKMVFDKPSSCLFFYDVKELVAQLPIKGIEFIDLVEPDFLKSLNHLQLELPFNWTTTKIVTTF